MLHIEPQCPICSAGSIGFRRCDDGATIVLMCDECHSVWLDPSRIEPANALYPRAPDFRVPDRLCSVSGRSAGWATRPEVERAGWHSYVYGEGTSLDGS